MSSSVQIAVDILTALLTGGFLLFFIECHGDRSVA